MKLYANGCSFTWGGEIFKNIHDTSVFPPVIMDENYISEENHRRLQVTWPKKLADKLGCTEFHNHGMGCGSNERIVRKTLQFFTTKINEGIDVSDYIAVIQWTDPSRFEFFDAESKSWAVVKHDVIAIEKSRPIKDIHFAQDLYNTYRYNNDVYWGSKLFASITCLGNFFKQHNIKHVFTGMNAVYSFIGFEKYQLDYCNENFTWYNGDIMKSGFNDMQLERCESTTHPSEHGHTQVAEHIYRFLSAQS
jgi:hypothetical protein